MNILDPRLAGQMILQFPDIQKQDVSQVSSFEIALEISLDFISLARDHHLVDGEFFPSDQE